MQLLTTPPDADAPTVVVVNPTPFCDPAPATVPAAVLDSPAPTPTYLAPSVRTSRMLIRPGSNQGSTCGDGYMRGNHSASTLTFPGSSLLTCLLASMFCSCVRVCSSSCRINLLCRLAVFNLHQCVTRTNEACSKEVRGILSNDHCSRRELPTGGRGTGGFFRISNTYVCCSPRLKFAILTAARVQDGSHKHDRTDIG